MQYDDNLAVQLIDILLDPVSDALKQELSHWSIKKREKSTDETASK